MKVTRNRKKKRGIKAVFCFLLAIGLMLGQLNTSVQAEENKMTDFETEKISSTDDKHSNDSNNTDFKDDANEEKSDEEEKNPITETEEEEKDPITETEEEEKDPIAETEEEEKDPIAETKEEEENPINEAECVCDSLCEADHFDITCPVCEKDYAKCAYVTVEEENVEFSVEKVQNNSRAAYKIGDVFSSPVGNGINLYYEVTGENQVKVIHHNSYYNWDSGTEIVIPEEVNGCKVVEIAEYTFRQTLLDNTQCLLGSIEIPDSVTVIGNGAFNGCVLLKSVRLPSSITTIPDGLFHECRSLENIVIPKSVTSIDEYAFQDCNSLKSLTIPNSVKNIGYCAFYSCENLEYITMPDHMESIGSRAFSECYKLKNIVIPDGITRIEDTTFLNCFVAESITISDTVTFIGKSAFTNCAFKEMLIPANVTEISNYAFSGCQYLTTLRIIINPKDNVEPVSVGPGTFSLFDYRPVQPEKREVSFYTIQNGRIIPLDTNTVPTSMAAKTAYDNVDDGTENYTDDGLWYGWTIVAASEIEQPEPDMYPVKIHVKKDGEDWNLHDRKFKLKNLSGQYIDYVEDITKVEAGEYEIYDFTEAADTGKEINTEIKITVNKDNTEGNAEIEYYTVTFHDNDTPYENETPQRQQIILSGGTVKSVPNPSKPEYRFDKWMTQKDGGEKFEFEESDTPMKITHSTDIYASWIRDSLPPVIHMLTVSVKGEGTVESPDKTIESEQSYTFTIESGQSRIFTIVPKKDYQLKSITMDGIQKTVHISENGSSSYTYTEPETIHETESHKLIIEFEKKTVNPDNENNPTDPGNNKTDSNGSDNNKKNPDDVDKSENVTISAASTLIRTEESNNNNVTDSNDDIPENNVDIINVNTATTDISVANTSSSGEPKTGDNFHLEIYASIAMIAGFVYLILYFMDGMKGMTEEEKNKMVSLLLEWGKRGKAKTLRKYITITILFFVLIYYHAFGKHKTMEWKEA